MCLDFGVSLDKFYSTLKRRHKQDPEFKNWVFYSYRVAPFISWFQYCNSMHVGFYTHKSGCALRPGYSYSACFCSVSRWSDSGLFCGLSISDRLSMGSGSDRSSHQFMGSFSGFGDIGGRLYDDIRGVN